MKYLHPLFLTIAVSVASAATSQEMPRHVFGAGGGSYQSGAIHASWTIGQAEAVATFYQPTVIVSCGFQQLDDVLVSSRESEQENNILVYPNPCKDFLQLKASFDQPTILSYKLYDFSGKIITGDKIPEALHFSEFIDLTGIAPGIYDLRMVSQSGGNTRNQSIKIIRN